jgi:hypothetical protein
MAGAYEAMRFLEIVLAGLRVATPTPRIYPSPFADRPSRHRSGACRKQAQIHEGHTILLGSSAGAPRTLAHDHEFFQDAERPTKKNVGIIGAPADGTLAAHCRPNGKFGTSV